MNKANIWYLTKEVSLNVSTNIPEGFDIGFDNRIPEDTRKMLTTFVEWVEDNFNIPICLWVDFEYKHYLLTNDKKRAGYLFYWADFENYPNFDDFDDIPQIRLPVRTEHWTHNEILASFIEAITYYFAWITNTHMEDYSPDQDSVEEILQEYLSSKR